MVELRGFEPLTFSLRTRRATNCATAPMHQIVATVMPGGEIVPESTVLLMVLFA